MRNLNQQSIQGAGRDIASVGSYLDLANKNMIRVELALDVEAKYADPELAYQAEQARAALRTIEQAIESVKSIDGRSLEQYTAVEADEQTAPPRKIFHPGAMRRMG